MSNYNIEVPQLAGMFNPDVLIEDKGKGVEWINGIICYEIPRDQREFKLYDMINDDLFHEDPIIAYLTEKKSWVNFIPHKDNGYVLIFPFKNIEDYILTYMDNDSNVIHEYKYSINNKGYVIPILHNGSKYMHNIIYNDESSKWWVQIQLNPKYGHWDYIVKQINNGNFFK